jgi:glycosyltransferase involved in cell wall biosynthesis
MKPFVLVGNRIEAFEQQSNDCVPRQDYVEIARRLGGDLLGYNLSDALWYHGIRRIEKRLKLDLVEAFAAATQFSNYDIILSTSEKLAIPLEALRCLTKHPISHVVIAHKLSSKNKRLLFQVWNPKTFSHIICVSRKQVDYAVNQLRIPESSVDFVYDKVDHKFFQPLKVDTDNYILAVGQEQRDYNTLLQAISGTGIKLVIVASSLWSTSRIEMDKLDQATVLSHIPYQELRMLYAKAKLVVAPLFEVDYAAGVNSVLEAMAVGKPLLVSDTEGIADYITHNETGIYVSPGNSEELRDTILSLWERPEELKRLGANARQVVEERMNLDIYVERIAEIMNKVAKSSSLLEQSAPVRPKCPPSDRGKA